MALAGTVLQSPRARPAGFGFSLTPKDQLLKRRSQAIEPIIGHLKGETGDRLHAVLCAVGYKIKWLLRMIAKKGVTFFRAVFCACNRPASLVGLGWQL